MGQGGIFVQGFFNTNFSTLKMAMDASSVRHQVIAQNIANSETPNYKRLEVRFEDELQKHLHKKDLSLKTPHPKHISNQPQSLDHVSIQVSRVLETSITNDENNVDLDREMALMAYNTIRYQTLSRLMEANIGRYYTVMRGA